MHQNNTKLIITALIIKELSENSDNPWKNKAPEELIVTWWQSGRSGNSLRLTETGRLAFDKAEIAFYDFDLDPKQIESWNKFTLGLTKKINCPYFIGLKNNDKRKAFVRIYDSKIAMMITLYGNIIDYINLR